MKKLLAAIIAVLLCAMGAVAAAAVPVYPGENEVYLFLKDGNAMQLELTNWYDDAPIVWSTDDITVVMVDENGVVTAQASSGTATIRAKSANAGLVATILVTIDDFDPLLLPPARPVPEYPAEHRELLDAMSNAYYDWVANTLEAALSEDELGRLERRLRTVDGKWIPIIERAERAEKWDAAVQANKDYLAAMLLVLEDNSKNIKAPDSLWAMAGGRPGGSGTEKIFGLFAGFLPESVARVVAAIVQYVFFGWLWGRWL